MTYEPGDAADLARAILGLVDRAARSAKLGLAAPSVASGELSWELEAVRYVTLMERCPALTGLTATRRGPRG